MAHRRLGRVPHFDPQNLDYRIEDVVPRPATRRARAMPRLALTVPDHPAVTRRLPRESAPEGHGPLIRYHNDSQLWLDQGDTSWCTWASAAHAVADGPVTHPEFRRQPFAPGAAFYAEEQSIDRAEHGLTLGPDDGATTLACCKALRRRGIIGEYRWGYTLEEAVAGALTAPLLWGTEWVAGFDEVGPDGVMRWRGASRGGHQLDINGVDVPRGFFRVKQSWRRDAWGRRGHGYLPFEALEKSLAAGADVVLFRELRSPFTPAGAAA